MTAKTITTGALIAAGLGLGAQSARADVTITTSSTTPVGEMVSTVAIAGLKMREDSRLSGNLARQFGMDSITNTRIVKLDEHETINISALEKRAIIQDKDYFDQSAKSGGDARVMPKVSFKPSGETRDVSGKACQVYEIAARFPISAVMPADAGAPEMAKMFGSSVMALSGTACLTPDVKGWEDYKAFYSAASAFYGRVTSPEGPATVLVAAVAEKGITLEMTMKGALEGGEDGAAAIPLLAQIVSSFANLSMRVTDISTDAVPATSFEIPADMPVTRMTQ
ncbi:MULTISPECIES: hypothetical protein [Rhodomicrobium]|uniref:hypothetical protein n=1 Tax=Rhodomicrobium TaxID=1068 RepID=UPI000B4B25A3|nr:MULTISPECIES: hypothetical protein [Rhodomicrobium]